VDSTAKEARRALNRLGRALEKAESELGAVAGALRHAEGSDFPVAEFDEAEQRLRAVMQFVDEQEQRLQEKMLHAGGIEPGRVRRGG
jgi:NAD+--asparagine ADP-ribosyltransferase